VLATERLARLLADLALADEDRTRGLHAHRAVRASLQAHYYGHLSIQDHSRLIGSWSRGTEVRPLRSIDLLFVLPKALREPGLPGSDSLPRRLLLDVTRVLALAHGVARVRPDAKAVTVTVEDTVVDVWVAFAQPGGRYLVCDAAGDGRFRLFDPSREDAHVRQSDHRTHGSTRDLIRMLKCWQGFRNVPLSSFALELLAIEFLATWPRAGDHARFYDWMIRDAFGYLLTQGERTVAVPGSDEGLTIGSAWLVAAALAHRHAIKAIDHETAGLNADAWWEWEKIFGERVPLGT
jgi:hypothetical protein